MNHMVTQQSEADDRADYDPDEVFERECQEADDWYDRCKNDDL